MAKEVIKDQSGFTLIEVLIAITIFAVFATTFVSSQGFNVLDSQNMRSEIDLQLVAQNKLYELKVDPPTFEATLHDKEDSKSFEFNERPYEVKTKWKQFKIKNLDKLVTPVGEDATTESGSQLASVMPRVASQLATNLENLIWQLEVTVRDKTTEQSTTLTTWFYNQYGDVSVGSL